MATGQLPGRDDRAAQIARDRDEPGPDLENGARVDDVLRRRAPVHVGARLAAASCERAHEGDERMLRPRDVLSQFAGVEHRSVGLGRDAFSRLRRDDADLRLRPCQRALGVEPALEQSAIVEDAPGLLRSEEVAP